MTVELHNTPELISLYIEEIKVYGAPNNIRRVYYDAEDLPFMYDSQVYKDLSYSVLIWDWLYDCLQSPVLYPSNIEDVVFFPVVYTWIFDG